MAAHNADFDTVLEYDPKCELVKTQPTNSRFVLDILLAKVQQPTAHTDFTAPQKSRAGKQPKGHDRARVQQSRGFWRGANVLREISGSVEDPRSRSEKLRPAGLLTIHARAGGGSFSAASSESSSPALQGSVVDGTRGRQAVCNLSALGVSHEQGSAACLLGQTGGRTWRQTRLACFDWGTRRQTTAARRVEGRRFTGRA